MVNTSFIVIDGEGNGLLALICLDCSANTHTHTPHTHPPTILPYYTHRLHFWCGSRGVSDVLYNLEPFWWMCGSRLHSTAAGCYKAVSFEHFTFREIENGVRLIFLWFPMSKKQLFFLFCFLFGLFFSAIVQVSGSPHKRFLCRFFPLPPSWTTTAKIGWMKT